MFSIKPDSIQCYSCKASGSNEIDANIHCLENAYIENCEEFYHYYNEIENEDFPAYDYYYDYETATPAGKAPAPPRGKDGARPEVFADKPSNERGPEKGHERGGIERGVPERGTMERGGKREPERMINDPHEPLSKPGKRQKRASNDRNRKKPKKKEEEYEYEDYEYEYYDDFNNASTTPPTDTNIDNVSDFCTLMGLSFSIFTAKAKYVYIFLGGRN